MARRFTEHLIRVRAEPAAMIECLKKLYGDPEVVLGRLMEQLERARNN